MLTIEQPVESEIVVEYRRSLLGRSCVGCGFTILALMLIVFLAIPFTGPRSIAVTCDRAVGGCTIRRGTATQKIALADLQKSKPSAIRAAEDRGVSTRGAYT